MVCTMQNLIKCVVADAYKVSVKFSIKNKQRFIHITYAILVGFKFHLVAKNSICAFDKGNSHSLNQYSLELASLEQG